MQWRGVTLFFAAALASLCVLVLIAQRQVVFHAVKRPGTVCYLQEELRMWPLLPPIYSAVAQLEASGLMHLTVIAGTREAGYRVYLGGWECVFHVGERILHVRAQTDATDSTDSTLLIQCAVPSDVTVKVRDGQQYISVTLLRKLLAVTVVVSDLPACVVHAASPGSNYNSSKALLAACATVHNADRRLIEWLEYYRQLGVDRFFLYDLNSDMDAAKRTQKLLQRYSDHVAGGESSKQGRKRAKAGIVQYLPWHYVLDGAFPYPHVRAQIAAQNDCLQRFGGLYRWISFPDIDEFVQLLSDSPTANRLAESGAQLAKLQPPKPAKRLKQFLRDHDRPDSAGVEFQHNLWFAQSEELQTQAKSGSTLQMQAKQLRGPAWTRPAKSLSGLWLDVATRDYDSWNRQKAIVVAPFARSYSIHIVSSGSGWVYVADPETEGRLNHYKDKGSWQEDNDMLDRHKERAVTDKSMQPHALQIKRAVCAAPDPAESAESTVEWPPQWCADAGR